MKVYKVKKGRHYSNFIPSFSKANSFSFQVCFDESCRYGIEEESCVNKLFGYCYGIFGVHRNSVRFGWTYDGESDYIDIWQYVYEGGKLEKKIITSARIGEWKRYEIRENKNGLITFLVNRKIVGTHTFKANTCRSKYKVTLGLYFGGNTRAPHDIEVKYK